MQKFYHTIPGAFPPSTIHSKGKALFFSLIFLIAWVPLRAQITYTDGEFNTNTYDTSPPNNPLTLETDSGTGTQVGAITGTGELDTTGAGTTVLTGTNTYTGKTQIESGTLQISGATGAITSTTLLYVDVGATLAIDTGGSVHASGLLEDGNGIGTGTISIGSGGSLSNKRANIGDQTYSTGTVSVTGTGSSWTSTKIYLGLQGGTGSLMVSAGGLVTDASCAIGESGSGTATVTGPGSTWTNSASLIVGDFASVATLAIANGGSVSDATGTIGAGSVGSVTVTGTGSTWTNSSALYIGGNTAFPAGNGTLNITNSGAVSSTGAVNIGILSNESGVLNISAGGSLGDVSGNLKEGTATVTGAGSTWTNSGDLNIANIGIATLTISNGGSVSNANGYVGVSDADATVTVTGTGSTWTNSNTLYVGDGGSGDLIATGTLIISAGGSVSSAGPVYVGADGGTGTLNLGAEAGDPAVAAGTLTGTSVVLGSNGGTGAIVFNHTETGYVFGASISGTGTVAVLAGNTILTGTNTYTGGTTISGGTLQIGSDNAVGSGPITITGGGIRASGTTRTLANALALDGSFTLGRSTNFTGDAVLGADITITSDNPDVGGAAMSTFSGVISGGHGLTFTTGVNPIGTIVLSGMNTYTGGTTVNSGTLQVDGAIANSATTVNGGNLQGTGTLGDVTMKGGTTLMPGDNATSLSTTLKTGALLFEAAATLQLKLDSASRLSDSITVTGQLTFDKTALVLTDLTSGQALAEGTVLTILTYAAGMGDGLGTGTDLLTYNGLSLTEGGIFDAGLTRYKINYAVGDPSITLTSMGMVPEPGTWLLLALGWGLLASGRRWWGSV